MPELKSQRDEPGTQREYETIFILRPMATSDQIQDVNNRVRRIVEQGGGKVLRLDNWGKRKLAYEIRKQLKGIYLYWLFLGDAGMVAEIERNLRMLDLVIRYFSVAVDEDVFPDARPSAVDDETFAAAATIIPDEEDAYMGRTFDEDEEDEQDEGEKKGQRAPTDTVEQPTVIDDAKQPAAAKEPEEQKPAEKPAAAKEPEEQKPAEKPAAAKEPEEQKPAEPAPEPAAEVKKEEE
jgi:small subunit ribosomal protein S6